MYRACESSAVIFVVQTFSTGLSEFVVAISLTSRPCTSLRNEDRDPDPLIV